MATRTLESERDRLTTMLILPLMSCGARLPIWMLLIPAFFAPAWRAPMLWIVYFTGIALALMSSLLLRRTVLKGKEAPFVMELPPYRLPRGRALGLKMAERSWLYLRKAGTVILAISILLWLATFYPRPRRFQVDEKSSDLRTALSRDYSPLVGLSLMLFLLIATPCMATFAVTRRESGSVKWALLQFGGLTLMGYLVSLLVFQLGRFFGLGG